MLEQIDLVPCTSRTITDRVELRRECDRVRTQGYATDWAEADEGIHCVAAPIFDRHRQLIAVIWVSAPSRRMPRESFVAVSRHVIRAADAITRRMME